MAVIANLDIVLGAQTGKASKGLKGFGSEIASLRRTLVGAAAAYLSFNAARQVFNSLVERGAALDALGEQAAVLGENVNNLNALTYAGQQAGSSQEELFAALARTNRFMGEAVAGGKAQREAIEGIGLSVQGLAAMSPVERLFAIGGALAGLGDSSKIAKAAAEIFGKSWAGVLTTLGQGRALFASATARLKELGASFTPAQLAMIDQAGDKLADLAVQFGALAGRALPTFAAALTSVVNVIGSITAPVRAMNGEFVTTVAKMFAWATAASVLIFAGRKVVVLFNQVRASILAVVKAQTILQALSSGKSIVGLLVAGGAVVTAWLAVDAVFDQLDKEMAEMEAAAGTVADAQDEIAQAAKKAKEEIAAGETAAAEGANAVADAMTEAKRKSDELFKSMQNRGADLRKSLRTPLEEFADDLKELQELAKFSAFSGETATRAVEAALQRLRDAKSAGGGEILNLGSAQRGSTEALTPFLQRRAPDPIQQDMLKAEQDAAATLKKIEDQLKRNAPILFQGIGLP